MKIATTRRICQIFFFLLFIWFCIVSTLGEQWWQLRGWPVNWLIQLDPLVGLGTLLATGALYAGLLWGLATVTLTIVLGRFFCGWICPFGALHQLVGWLANRGNKASAQINANRYRSGQRFKYILLVFILTLASGEMIGRFLRIPVASSAMAAGIAVALLLLSIGTLWVRKLVWRKWILISLTVMGIWVAAGWFADGSRLLAASLQTGLLDPIPLFYRSVNLALLPLMDGRTFFFNPANRIYPGAFAIGAIFWAAVFLNLVIPRFYCRFICPLGALFGVIGMNALYRVGRKAEGCTACGSCDRYCEGGCAPSGTIRTAECTLCMNCLASCRHGVMGYHLQPSASGEIAAPDISKREFVASFGSGLVATPLMRLAGGTGANWHAAVVRPPGALPETVFLQRCIKCGQCMRVCPTNVIHPAGLSAGLEGVWTPVLNFRIGTSGCQQGCIACGNLCPTAAIRPISVDERRGQGAFADRGPVRIGTAFVDRGRCLPWAMDRPCIVCQENCPVSPKAIFTRDEFRPVVLSGELRVRSIDGNRILFDGPPIQPNRYSSGDYFLSVKRRNDAQPARLTAATANTVTVTDNPILETAERGDSITLLVRLQLPYVDPQSCIGCGVCEHECPVKGKRAIRVTAENESRERRHRLIL